MVFWCIIFKINKSVPDFSLSRIFVLSKKAFMFVPSIFLLKKIYIGVNWWENVILIFKYWKWDFSYHNNSDQLARSAFFSIEIEIF